MFDQAQGINMNINFDKKKLIKLSNSVECYISSEPVGYSDAIEIMENRVNEILNCNSPELIWLLEHPSIYTAGTSARVSELIDKKRFPVYQTGRGGRYTYHGPGQRVVYVMLDLSKRGNDIRKFVHKLENWIISSLNYFNIISEVHDDRIGIWVKNIANKSPKPIEKKIAAIGIRIRKGITYHGVAININPELEHFSGIIPCGIKKFGVTSLSDIGLTTTMEEFDEVLLDNFVKIFKDIDNNL